MVTLRIFIFLLCLAPLAALADLSATLDRSEAMVGETITLTLETTDPQQSLDAELSVLEEDFHVLGQQSESQISIINGQQAARIRVLVTLEPKHEGRLQIPPLPIGSLQTQPLVLNVKPAPQRPPGTAEPVFIETEFQPAEDQVWVHGQINLVIRLFYEFRLSEGGMSEPNPEHASVQLLNERPYQAQRNNTRYWVLERRYAVFPERSGELVIPAVEFTGRINERPAQGSLWNNNRGRRVRVEGTSLAINVKPKPADYPEAPWLPARAFEASQSISIPDGGLKVGEPVTRTVTLDVVGLDSSMLPELSWPELENARVYPDSPETITRNDGSWLTTRSQSRFAVVPEQPGTLVLPELRIPWWDTANSRLAEAVIPEEVVTVLASPNAIHTPPAVAASQQPDVVSGSRAPGAASGRPDPGPWPVLAMLFAVLWLVTLFAWLRKRPVPGPASGAIATDPDQQQALEGIRKACRQGEAAAAARLLREWLRVNRLATAEPGLTGLAELVDDAELKTRLLELDRLRWAGAGESQWNGKLLWSAFERWRKNRFAGSRKRGGGKLTLPRLYAG